VKIRLTLIFLALILVSCDSGQPTVYQGGLYFGQGSYLMRLSLRDGSLSVEGHLGDTVIREISAFGTDRLLIAESASVNRRRVQRISWFDLRTGETADLYAGTRARFLQEANIVVYDDGSEIFAVPQIHGSPNQVIYTHAKNQLEWMTEAPVNMLLIEAEESGQSVIYSWDSASGELNQLDALTATCRLPGSVWIESVNRLACKSRNSPFANAGYLLTDIDGNVDGELDLPTDERFRALAFIESQDALVLQETFQGMLGSRDQYAVWIIDILSGESHRVPGNVKLGNSVVYAEY
jgi:hypothetical protein